MKKAIGRKHIRWLGLVLVRLSSTARNPNDPSKTLKIAPDLCYFAKCHNTVPKPHVLAGHQANRPERKGKCLH